MPLFGQRDDGTRRRQRPSGSRIVMGLGALHNLDYAEQPPKEKKKRTETTVGANNTVVVASPTTPAQESISAGVFGAWEDWRTAFRTLFPNANAKENAAGSSSAHSQQPPTLQQQLSALRSTLQRLESLDGKAQTGLAMIDLWRVRARNDNTNANSKQQQQQISSMRIPRYIEATAVLVESQMMDRAMLKGELYKQMEALHKQVAAEATTNAATVANSSNIVANANAAASSAALVAGTLAVVRPTVVANSYGGAISRALHILTGGLIKTNSFVDEESSYRSRAQDIGVPEELVEVRRRVAHGGMPLLSELRLTAALGMEHLHDRYWALQESQVKKLLREDERDAKKKVRAEGGGNNNKRNQQNNKRGGALAVPEKPKSVGAADVMALLANLSSSDEDEAEAGDDAGSEEDMFVESL